MNRLYSALPQKKAFLLGFAFVLSLMVGFVVFGAWLWYGSIDESVPGAGQIVPERRLRRIMAPMAGMVAKVYVQENQKVRAGEKLIELDPEPAAVQAEGIEEQIGLIAAEIQVLKAAALSHTISAPVNDVSQAWLAAALEAYNAQRAEAKQQIERFWHDYQEALAQVDSTRQVLKTSEKLLLQYRALYHDGGLAEKDLREYEQTVERERGQLSTNLEAVKTAKATYDQAKERPALLAGTFRRDILSRLSELQVTLAQLKAQSGVSRLSIKHEVIKAPISGIVNEQIVRGPGDVVTQGQTLLSLVPLNSKMLAEVRVTNRDLSYIHLGQRALLRLDAFPYQHFGKLYGVVESISPSTQSPSNVPASQAEPNDVQQQQPYFVVTIRPERYELEHEGHAYPLRSGMSVSADIITRQKNIISFFTEPVQLHFEKAFKDPTNR